MMALKILFTIAVWSVVSAYASETDSEEAVYVATHEKWTANVVRDTFDDTEIRRFVFTKVGEHGSVRAICTNLGSVRLSAYADNIFAPSLGSMFSSSNAIKVRSKVDSNAVIESEGAYPYTVATGEDALLLVRQMRQGKELRMRTEHEDEKHTFRVSLKGFADAADWAMAKCPEALKPTDN